MQRIRQSGRKQRHIRLLIKERGNTGEINKTIITGKLDLLRVWRDRKQMKIRAGTK